VGKEQRKREPLTQEQRRLVRENIGLVVVHMRRYVANLSQPRRDREWEDLFQEGCLGLMDAATRFRPERGIPFIAFALPRIHNAVSKALHAKFSTVHVPVKRTSGESDRGTTTSDTNSSERPGVYSLAEEMEEGLVAAAKSDPTKPPGETIGQRMREKYERAVQTASREIAGKTSTRGDRDELVRILIEERLLVPHEESRRALRQIARDTKSSYARVAQCDRQLNDAVRRVLQSDPEFGVLKHRARADPMGCEVPVDEEIEHALVSAGADELTDRFRKADPQQRGRLLHTVLEASPGDMEDLLRRRFLRLSRQGRDRLLEDTADLREAARPDRRRLHRPDDRARPRPGPREQTLDSG